MKIEEQTKKLLNDMVGLLDVYTLALVYFDAKRMMKQSILMKDFVKIENILDKLWLQFVLSDFFYLNKKEAWSDENSKIIYIWKNKEDVLFWKELESCIDSKNYCWYKQNKDIVYKYNWKHEHIFWELLGYPKCCINYFFHNLNENRTIFDLVKYCLSKTKKSHKLLNPLEYFIINHIPCSFDCKESLEIANKNFSIYKKLTFLNNPISDFDEKYKYILFKTWDWIKSTMVNDINKYTYWNFYMQNNKSFENIKNLLDKHLFKLGLVNDSTIKIFNDKKILTIKDILILDYSN